MSKVLFIPLALVLSCAACSILYEGKYARDDGWRHGKVFEVASGAELAQAGWRDCRKGLPAAELSGQFATVEFFGSHRLSSITVPVRENAGFARGDRVYVDISDCKVGLEARFVD